MSQIRVQVLDRQAQRSEREVTTGTTAGELFPGDRDVVVARVNGEVRDLSWVVSDGDVVEPVPADSPTGRSVIRHSSAHVLAQAVQQAFPEAKLGIGPPIENGFYYDFQVDRAFTPEDLKLIESRMRDIVKQGQRFVRREVTDADARAELADEPFKLELIGIKGSAGSDDEASTEVGAGVLTIYDNVDAKTGELRWKDLCRGPHVPTTRQIPAFKLMRNAGAYWRGSEKNPQLQRIYGTAWESRAAQDEYLKLLEEAERRDHRKLGAELDLFSFPEEIGSGLPVFHPKGGIIRREMENYSRLRHEAAGYSFVNTPHITKAHLFETSGHLPYYADTMFPPMELEGSEYYLKAMNCPMHNLVYRSRGRSYRELPLRLFEFGAVYRYEKSGVVHGLTRVRGLTMDDSHIYCTKEQMEGELTSVLSFILDLLRDYGLDDFYLELSTRGDSDKFIGVGRGLGVGDRDPPLGRQRVRPGTGARPGRRGLLRAEDLRPGARRDRPDLADVHRPARLQPAPAVRARVPGGGRLPAGAGNDPPGAVRLDRAVHGRAHRALRGRAAAVAGPGPGDRHPDQRRARPVPGGGRGQARRPADPGRDRRQQRPDAEEDPQRPEAEGPLHAAGGRRGRGRRRRLLPLPQRRPAQRRPDRRGDRRDRRRRRDPRPGLAASAPGPSGILYRLPVYRIPMYSRPHGET